MIEEKMICDTCKKIIAKTQIFFSLSPKGYMGLDQHYCSRDCLYQAIERINIGQCFYFEIKVK